jgi:hypothetical protein
VTPITDRHPDQHHAEVRDRGTYGELMETIDEIIRDIFSGDPAPNDGRGRRRGRFPTPRLQA